MNIKLNAKYIIAFTTLLFVMHEAHEIVHTSLGRLICGDWGKRDFNLWGLAEGCSENTLYKFLPTLAGPLFSFAMMWIGAFMLKQNNSILKKSLGFSLIFANMPFGRILTAAFGGGDEVYTLSNLTGNHTLAWIMGFSSIVLICAYPMYKAFITINKNKIGWFSLFFFAPLAIDLLVVLGLMNTLLENGILSEYWILGSPMLVTLWTFLVVVILLFTYKHLFTLGNSKSINHKNKL